MIDIITNLSFSLLGLVQDSARSNIKESTLFPLQCSAFQIELLSHCWNVPVDHIPTWSHSTFPSTSSIKYIYLSSHYQSSIPDIDAQLVTRPAHSHRIKFVESFSVLKEVSASILTRLRPKSLVKAVIEPLFGNCSSSLEEGCAGCVDVAAPCLAIWPEEGCAGCVDMAAPCDHLG